MTVEYLAQEQHTRNSAIRHNPGPLNLESDPLSHFTTAHRVVLHFLIHCIFIAFFIVFLFYLYRVFH